MSPASQFGQLTRTSDFFAFNFRTRFNQGVQLGGGVDTGRTAADRCFVVDSPQESLNCREVTPFSAQTQVKVFGSYALPRGFVASGIFQNVSGPTFNASYSATNAQIAPSLGRNLAACGTRVPCTATATVPLIAPQTMFEDRRTQLDLRLTKHLEVSSKVNLELNLDAYNVLNASSTITLNSTYGPSWQRPTSILDGRLIEFGGRLTF